MDEKIENYVELGCVYNVLLCILLASMYVGSLYVWGKSEGRDHPSTVKKRSFSVFLMSFVSAIFVYMFADREYFGYDVSFFSLLGLRLPGLFSSVVLPLILTMILFLGPISLQYNDGMYSNFLAHLHHLSEKLAYGDKFKVAVFQSCHVAAPFIVHAFCNFMGFPDFGQLLDLEQPKKTILMTCFVVGLVLWIILLYPMTNPLIYDNALYTTYDVQ